MAYSDSVSIGGAGRVAALVLLGLVLAGTARASVCAMPRERSALEARVLQTQLMVAALACNQRRRYNAFVERFRADLVVNGKAVRAYFQRAYGAAAEPEVNRFMTRIANQASARSLVDGFCAEAATLFDRLEEPTVAGLAAVAADQPFVDTHGIAACRR